MEKRLASDIDKLKMELADPRHRTPDAHLRRREKVRSIITELKSFRPSQEKIFALGEARKLEWENPLLAYEEKAKTRRIVHVPATMLKKSEIPGETKFYFPAHFREFEGDGLKVSCSLIETGLTSDLHYHKNFEENINVAKGSIFLTTFGPTLTNGTMLKAGTFTIIPKKVSHNFKTETDSIVFTEKIGAESVEKMPGISEVEPPRERLDTKGFEKVDEGEIEAYSRLSVLDYPHRLGFLVSNSEKAFEYTMSARTFYFCVEGSMLVSVKQGETWKEKPAEAGSVTIFNEGVSVNLTFSKGATALYIAEVNI